MSTSALKVQLKDILKDARAQTVAGIAMVALWVTLLPQYKETVESQRAVRHLAAYLQIKQLMRVAPADLRFYVGDSPDSRSAWNSVIPEPEKKLDNFESVSPPTPDSALKQCREHFVPYPTGISDRNEFFMVSRKCKELYVHLPDSKSTPVLVQFTLESIAANHNQNAQQAYLYSIRTESTALPYSDYKLVLTWRNRSIPGALFVSLNSGQQRSEEDARREIQALSGWCNISHKPMDIRATEFHRCYTAYVLQSEGISSHPLVTSNAAIAGGKSPDDPKNLAQKARHIIHSSSNPEPVAREPKYWLWSQGLLMSELGKAPDLHELNYDTPAVKQLITKVLHNEGSTDVGGVKVPVSLLPWAIAALLGMITCLLYGSIASLRRATGHDASEDFGWLLMQTGTTHGRLSEVISTMLVLIGGAALAWVIISTVMVAIDLGSPESLALSMVTSSLFLFGLTSIWLAFQQRVLARAAVASP